jgi:formylglycine-generating enzyme required for sulfatase activity
MLRELEFVAIPRGTLLMGSTAAEQARAVREWSNKLLRPTYAKYFGRWISKEGPAHYVDIEPYCIARFPVTIRLFRRFLRDTRRDPPESILRDLPADHPVWPVDAASIQAFLAWAREETGRALRLPTEAEWEYAARGIERLEYPFGGEFDSRLCNTFESGRRCSTPVTLFEAWPSPFGVCDMAGNVEEWTSTEYAPYPGGIFVDDHLTESLGARYTVLRGGSAELGGDLARCARRHGPYPIHRMVGIRLAYDYASSRS